LNDKTAALLAANRIKVFPVIHQEVIADGETASNPHINKWYAK
jgi:hypothetical protein